LKERSNKIIIDSLQKNGFKIEATGPEKTVPLTCYPGQSLPVKPISVAAHTTSQFLSGWLLALAAVGSGEIELSTPLVSAPYVDMTCRVLEEAGVQVNQPSPGSYSVDASNREELDYAVPADYSSAAFFIVGASLTNSSVVLKGLDPDDVQGDRRIVDIIFDLGGNVKWTADGLAISGPFKPSGFEIDAADCPDLVPILTVLASRASGPVRLFNIEHLANKESDRINMTCRELKKTGLDIRPGSDCIEINPRNSNFHSGEVILNAHNDHRLAMAFSILGLCRGNIIVQEAQCVAKSYPGFYEDLLDFGAAFEKTN
jgi:3-phosphoshikimate 1-carboxyvinyltransferase